MIEYQAQGKTHTETGYLGWNLCEAPLAAGRTQIDMNPGRFGGHEALQKPGCLDVIAATRSRTLQYIRHLAFDIFVKIIVQWKWPYAFAGVSPGFNNGIVQSGAIGECTAVAFG